MKTFSEIFDRAARRYGGAEALNERLKDSLPKTPAEIEAIPDDRWLSDFTKGVFRAGFSWKVIDNKWPGFEAAFESFDPGRWALSTDEDLDQLARDERIVRNPQKIRSVRENAVMICNLAKDHGSAGAFFANYPATDYVGLLAYLHKNGSRLGGTTGPYCLRFAGVDSLIFSTDVVAALIDAGVVDKNPTSKTAQRAVQEALNQWMKESGRGLNEISRTLALSIDA